MVEVISMRGSSDLSSPLNDNGKKQICHKGDKKLSLKVVERFS
jgi:hypothetical protein